MFNLKKKYNVHMLPNIYKIYILNIYELNWIVNVNVNIICDRICLNIKKIIYICFNKKYLIKCKYVYQIIIISV